MSLGGYSLFIALVAGSNLLLGFCGAIALGHGPRLPAVKLRWAWREWLQAIVAWRRAWLLRRRSAAGHAETPAASASSLTLTPIQFSDVPEVSPATLVVAMHKPASIVEENSLDAVLAQLSREVAAVRSDLDDIDERVRMCSGAPTVDAVEECVADLRQTGQRLYEQQTQAIAAVYEVHNDRMHVTMGDDKTHVFVEQQAELLRQSLAELDAWHVDPHNLDADCRRLLDATEQLMHSCDDVGETLENAAQQRSTGMDSIGH